MDIEYNLLYAVLALQLEMIDTAKLADVCAAWAARRDKTIAELLRERGWLSDDDHRAVAGLLDRKLRRHGGDARAGLEESLNADARAALLSTERADLRRSVDGLDAIGPRSTPLATAETDQARCSPTVDYASPAVRFRSKNLHAEGGLGQVWRARDAELERDVALKRIKPARRGQPEAQGMLRREALITGQLEHPNIVPVYDLGRDPADLDPYYVMKLIRGRPLRDAIRELHAPAGGQPDPAARRRLLGNLVQVGQAVAYAHARGVLHLDLKPANVVLGDFGEVVVLDWGLARLRRVEAILDGSNNVDPDLPTTEAIVLAGEALVHQTASGRVQGTMEYMAPEQATGIADSLDERTDVFGLGAILFTILTGRSPRRFEDSETDGQIVHRVRTEPVPNPREVCAEVPLALDTLCARALAHDPIERLPNAVSFVAALEAWLADEPLAAYREIIAGFDAMVRSFPDVIDYREQLARNRANLGLVLDGMGRRAEAEATYRRAIADYEGIVKENPLLPGPRADLAATRTHLHRTLLALGRPADAEASRQAALADYAALAEAHPPARDYTTGLASVYITMYEAPRPAEPAPGPQGVPSTAQSGDLPARAASPAASELSPPSVTSESSPGEAQALGDRGRLEVRGTLARGAMGSVFRAHDRDLNRDVAVKVLPLRAGFDEVRRRFVREAQLAAQLEHPHILPVYALGFRSQDEAPFLVMRLVGGDSLRSRIRVYHQQRRPGGRHTAELKRLIVWLVEVCDALGFAHSRGVVHRDPKPDNVLLGASGEALLMDWGLAGVLDEKAGVTAPPVEVSDQTTFSSEAHGTLAGTPAYMAPEQVRGDPGQIGPRTDIYAMGVSLFEVLTGQLPFRPKGGIAAMLSAHIQGPTPRAREVDRAVPAPLDAICARAMARDPAARYASAYDLKHDLEAWLRGGLIAAYPESRLGRAWRRLWSE
jgi:serine/threonine protein kinase